MWCTHHALLTARLCYQLIGWAGSTAVDCLSRNAWSLSSNTVKMTHCTGGLTSLRFHLLQCLGQPSMPTAAMPLQGAGVGITPFASVLRTLVKEFEMAKCQQCDLVKPVMRLSRCSCIFRAVLGVLLCVAWPACLFLE